VDPKTASRQRWEKEKQLNELIAQGLKNLNELRNPASVSVESTRRSPASSRGRSPSSARSCCRPHTTTRNGAEPRQPVRRQLYEGVTSKVDCSPRQPRSSSQVAPSQSRRARSQSPASQFAYFHSGYVKTRAPEPAWQPHAWGSPLNARKGLPPKPPRSKSQDRSGRPKKLTREELEEFYARQEDLQQKRLSRQPLPEPEHIPRVRSASQERVPRESQVWDTLYVHAVQSREKRKHMVEYAQQQKAHAEEKEAAQYLKAPKKKVGPNDAHERLYNDRERLMKERKEIEKKVDVQFHAVCTFHPEIHHRLTEHDRGESQEEMTERLFQEAEQRAGRIEKKRDLYASKEKSAIEKEHRLADHHYARRAQREEERARERKMREMELQHLAAEAAQAEAKARAQTEAQARAQAREPTPPPPGPDLEPEPEPNTTTEETTDDNESRPQPTSKPVVKQSPDFDVVSDDEDSSTDDQALRRQIAQSRPPPASSSALEQARAALRSIGVDSESEKSAASSSTDSTPQFRRQSSGTLRERLAAPPPRSSQPAALHESDSGLIHESDLWTDSSTG